MQSIMERVRPEVKSASSAIERVLASREMKGALACVAVAAVVYGSYKMLSGKAKK